MIIQLPNGRIIECSLEQYLALSDDEVKDLNGLSTGYTKEVSDPFYNSFAKPIPFRINDDDYDDYDYDEELLDDLIIDWEPELDEINVLKKLENLDLYLDDI